jgi:predicted transcriptional regulator
MKGQKQSKVKVLENKVKALTNIVQQLIREVQANTTMSEGTLTAFQIHVGKDEWEKIVDELKNKEQRDVEQRVEKRD